MTKLKTESHLPALDGIRGLAVLWVLVHHFGLGGDHTYPGTAGKVFFTFTTLGWAGVDLFFVLSGFLITRILLTSTDATNYFRAFYGRRTLRIFPLYFGALTLVLLVLPLAGAYPMAPFSQQVWYWAYLQNLTPLVFGEWAGPALPKWITLGHFWSLAVEEHFYLIWPVVVLMFHRRGFPAVCAGVIALSLGLRAWFVWRGADPGVIPYYVTFCRLDGLAAGALLAWVAVNRPWALRRLGIWAMLGVVSVAGVVMLFVLEGLDRDRPTVAVLAYTLYAGLFTALVAIAISDNTARGPLRAVLTRPTLVLFGKLSYGMYVYHALFVMGAMKAFVSVETLTEWTGRYVVSVAIHVVIGLLVTLGVSLVSWHVFEKHFLGLKKWFPYHRPGAAARDGEGAGVGGSSSAGEGVELAVANSPVGR